MSAESSKHKIIFLVDVSLIVRQNKEDKNVDATINLISASALKLLVHFASLVKGESRRLQWGYKFYSASNQRYAQRNVFRDFNVKEFEEFENDLQQLLEDGFSHQPVSHLEHSNKDNIVKKNSGHNVKLPCGSDRSDKLSAQLKEIICDFQWHGPDITSPVKSRRRSSRIPSQGETLNAVFLFSDCPRSISDVTSFATCEESMSPEDLLAEFLPSSVFQQFCVVKGLRLYWVDTDVLPKVNSQTCVRGLTLMNGALAKVRGCVIPASMLVQSGSKTSSNILHSCSRKVSHHVSAPLLSLETVVQHYMCRNSTALPCTAASAILACGAHLEGHTGQLTFHVTLQPVLKARSAQPCISSIHLGSSTQSADSQEIKVDVKSTYSTSSTSTQKTLVQQETTRASMEHWRIETIATLPCNKLLLSSLEPDAAYVVLPKPSDMESPCIGVLLQDLARRNQVLVVSLSHPSSSSSCMAALQPLTSTSATLTLVKSASSFLLNKALCFPDMLLGQEGESMAKFVQEKCTAHMPQLAQLTTTSMHESRSKAASSVSRSPVPLAESFNPNFLADFFVTEAKSQQQDKIMSLLRENDGYKHEREREMHRVRTLRQHYLHQKAQRRPHLVAPSQPSPHAKSQRKSHTSLPRKSSAHNRSPSPRKRLSNGKLLSPRKRLAASKRATSPRKKLSQALKRVRSSTVSTRSDLIFNRSKEALSKEQQQQQQAAEKEETKTRDASSSRSSSSRTWAKKKCTEFESIEDLVKFVEEMYSDVVCGQTEVVAGCHMITNLVLHYCTRNPSSSTPQERACEFLSGNLLLTTKALRQKYKAKDPGGDDKRKEFCIQALLYMEVSSLQVHQLTAELIANTTTQVAGMLRTLSFLRDANFMAEFLQEVLLDGYCETLPRLLISIYEELLQPLPSQLQAMAAYEEDSSILATPASANPSSVQWNLSASSVSVQGSVVAQSDRKLREKKPLRFPSFQMESGRQISVPVKGKEKVKKTVRSSARLSCKKVKKQQQEAGSEAKKVCRNLFDDEEGGVRLVRRQSIADMETSSSHSLKASPEKKALKVLKTKSVTETPQHKQKRGSFMLRRLQRERKRANTVTAAAATATSGVTVVQESPEKACRSAADVTIVSPSPVKRRASIQLARRSSFYSAGPTCRSRCTLSYEKLESTDPASENNAKLEKLEQRMKDPLLSPGWNEKTYRPGDLAVKSTPRRILPKSLFAMLKSPSPHKAPRHHSLNFDTPSKNTRARSLFLSPEIDRSKTVLNTPQKDNVCAHFSVINSPKQGLSTPKRKASQSPCELSSHKQLKRMCMSPTVASRDTESQGFDASDLLLSPAQSTRSHSKSGSVSKARANLSVLFSPNKNTQETSARKQFAGSDVSSPMFTNTSIFQSTKISTAPEENTEEYVACNPFAKQSPVKRDRSSTPTSCASPKTVFRTPPLSSRSNRNRSKSPSPKFSPEINQWPRRKSRASMNGGTTSCSKSSSGANQDPPTEIHRRIRTASSKSPVVVLHDCAQNCANQQPKLACDVNKDVENKQTLQSSSSTASSLPSDVFLADDNACDLPLLQRNSSPNRDPVSVSPQEQCQKFNSDYQASGVIPSYKSFGFDALDTDSNVPSPVFPSPVAKPKELQKKSSREYCDSDDTLSSSPVFSHPNEDSSKNVCNAANQSPRKAILTLPHKSHGQEKSTLPATRNPSPTVAKKSSSKTSFSPLSTKGLLTLMESPLLSSASKRQAPEREHPKSKESLYR